MGIFGAVGSFFKSVGTRILNAWKAADTIGKINMVLSAATFAVGVKGFLQARDMLAKGQDIMANKVAAGGKIPVIYGTRRVGAQIVYMDTAQNRSKDLFVVYALCVGEVESIIGNTIELDGNAITDKVRFRDGWYLGSDKINSGAGSLCTADQVGSGTSASTQRAGQSGTDPTKKYRAVFNLHHGAASQTADPMLRASIGSQWTTAHRLDGIAYIAASFEYDTKGMWKGVPQLTVQVKGRKVFDPRTSTTAYSDNAALCFLDFIRNNEYGKGIPDAKINMTTFSAAANLADTQLNVPYYNGNFQNVTFNGRSGDNFITITDNEDWWQNKVDQRITLKDSDGTTIIDDKSIDAVTRYKYFGETTQDSRVYFDGVVPPRDTTADGGVTLSATNGDATITVTDNSHGAAANDEVLLTGAVSLGGNITAAVINQVYTIATVINANSYTIEAEDLSGTTVLANSSDTGNGGNAVGAKYQYKNDDGTIRGKSKRFTCNGYIDTNKNVMDNAKELLANMRGIFTYFDGKYELKIEDTGSATFNITDAHIIEDNGISVDYGNKDAKANKVIVEFFNANKRYELDTATVFHNASPQYFSDDGDEILEIKAEFPYVTSPYIAYNMAKTILTRSRNQTKVSFLGTAEMYKLNIGDIVDLTYAGLGFSSKLFIVEALELQPNGLVGVSLLEYFDVYTWEVPPQEPTEPLQNTPSAYAVSQPANVAFTDTNASPTGRPRITWDAPTDYPDYEFRVAISDSGGNALQNSLVETNFVDLNFIPVGSNYVASVTSINSTGSESNATTLTFSVANAPIKTVDIQANAITANEINVTNLAAIESDLGDIDAGSINIGSGAFIVTSSGAMTANNATVTGNITASSLNVTGATVTGTIDASKITLNGDPLTDIFALAGSGQAKTLSLGGDTKNLLKVDGIQLKYFAFDQVQNQGTEVLQMDLDDLELFNTRLDHKQTTIKSEGSIVLSSISAPSSTGSKLYNVGGTLHFNGTALGTGTGDITAVVAGTNLNGGGTSGSVTLNLDSTITGNHTFSNDLTLGGNLTLNNNSNYIATRQILARDTNGLSFKTSGGATTMFYTHAGDVTVSNNLNISGDLTVQGTTTTIDTTNLEVKDKNITLNFSTGDSSANADGAGITIQDAVNSSTDATILWDATNDEFDFSHSITLPDNQKLQFGASNDLVIDHDAVNTVSRIIDNSGILNIQQSGDDGEIRFQSDDGSGSVTTYYQISGQFETNIFLKDIKVGDNIKGIFGASNDLLIYHDGNDSRIQELGTGNLLIDGQNRVNIRRADNGNFMGSFIAGGAVELYHNAGKRLETTSTGVDVTGTLTATSLAGTLSTASQPNITSVGTLTSLSSGAITSTGQVKAQSLFIDSGGFTPSDVEGRHFKYYLVGQGTDQNFKKVADVTIGTGNYKALAMRVVLESQSGNFGNTVAVDKTEYVCNFYRSAASQDSEDTATISGQDPTFHNLRIVKTATGVYELQVKQNANFRDAILHIEILSTNGGSITITDGNVNGSTSGTITTPNSIESQSTYSFNKVDTPFLNIQSNIKVNSTQILDSSRNLKDINSIGVGVASPAFTNGSGIEIEKSGTATLRIQRLGGDAAEIFMDTNGFHIKDLSHGTMTFGTANTERMRLNSTGLGIGTTSPSASLDVFSSDASIATFTRDLTTDVSLNVSADNSGTILSTGGVHAFRVFTNSAERMRIDSSGNAIFTKSGGAYLQLKDASAVRGAINVETSDGLVFTTGSSFTERMRIDSSGNVLIGTNISPFPNGTGLGVASSSSIARLILQNSTTGTGTSNGFRLGVIGNNVEFENVENGNQSFFNNGAERFKIASDGKTTFNSVITIPATVPSSKGGKALRFPVDADVSGTTELEFFTPLSSPASTLTVNNTLTAGAIDIPSDGTNDTRIKIGTSPLANHHAFIDLIGDTTYTGYGLRLKRFNGGANAISQLVHRGTGSLFIEAQDTGNIILKTNGSSALTINSSQNATFAGTITASGKITSTELTITGGTDSEDIYINNTSPTLGFTDSNSFSDSNDVYLIRGASTGKLQFQFKDDSAGTTTQTFLIDQSGNTDIAGTISSGDITSGDITIEEGVTPALTLSDTGNAGGGGASGKVIFKNTGGDAMGIGYTANVVTDSDMIISTNAGGTYGGYLGLDANAITDSKADIVLEPKTNVFVATGNVGIGISSPQAPLSFANSVGNKIDFYHTTGGSGDRYGIQVQSSELRIHSGNLGSSSGGITFGKSTTSSFVENVRFTNAGNVGIGNPSPSAPLDVSATATTGTDIAYFSNSNNVRKAKFHLSSGGDGQLSLFDGANNIDVLISATGNSYFNSGGNFLVSKTSSDLTTDGIELRDTGGIVAIRTNGDPLYLNRKSTDGAISTFAKDGTTIGVIGTKSGDLIAGTGDTGIRFDDANNAIYAHNTSTNAYVDDAISLGFAGIRFKDLHLSGSINSTKYDINNEGGGALFQTDGYLRFANGNTETVRIDSSGRLLAGTTSVGARQAHTFARTGSFATEVIQQQSSAGASVLGLTYSAAAPNNSSDYFIYAQDTAGIKFLVRSNGNIHSSGTGNFGNLVNALAYQVSGTQVISSARNLENIGTVSTTHFQSLANVNSTGDGGVFIGNGKRLGFDQTGTRSWTMKAASGYFNLESGDGNSDFNLTNNIGLRQNGTLVLDSSRNLTNIGTYSGSGNMTVAKSTTPIVVFETTAVSGQDATLKIRGARTASNTSDIATIFFDNKTSSPYTLAKIIARDPSANHGLGNGQLILQTSSSGGLSNALVLDNSQNATFSGNVTAFSDERLKDNIQTLDGKKALQMRGVSFTKDGKKGSGVIAQEIEKIAPELVLTAKDEQGTKSVAYGNLVGYLIEAIKDQQEQIDELKAKLDDCA